MIEWSSDQSLIQMANDVLSRRVPISAVPQAHLPAEITDDRPTMSTLFYVGGPHLCSAYSECERNRATRQSRPGGSHGAAAVVSSS